MHPAVGTAHMGADLIVPASFRTIAQYLVYVIFYRTPHLRHELLLQHVTEHLSVVAPCLVALAHRRIHVALARNRKPIAHIHLGQKLQKVFFQPVRLVDIDIFRPHRTTVFHCHGVSCRHMTVVTERDTLIIEPHTRR